MRDPCDMAVQPIPDQDHGASEMAQEQDQEFDDQRTIDVEIGVQSKAKRDTVFFRGNDDSRDGGDLFVGPAPLAKDGGSSPKAPGSANEGSHQEPRFIEEDEMGAES